MNTYKSENIRNVAVLGHGGCGKTTLLEAVCFATGVTSRMGRVEDGNTVSDYDKEEIKRQFSISASMIPVEFEDIKVNFLDCPGYFDFVGEAEEAIDAAGAAIIVINAKSGIQVGTIKAWEICERRHLPRVFFVTAMDDPNANFAKVVEDLKATFGQKVAPFHCPFFEDGVFTGFVNVVKMGGRRFTKGSQYVDGGIPDSVKDEVDLLRHDLIEAVAETDDVLLEKYFNEEEFTNEEIRAALHKSIFNGNTVPVLAGAAINGQGTLMLLNAIKSYFPSPLNHKVTGKNLNDESDFVANYDINKPFSAKVFKTIVDPFIGKYSLVKVCSGMLKADSTIYNAGTDTEEKLSRLYVMRGKEAIEVKELYPGDFGAIGKLSNTQTGDTLSTKATPIKYPAIRFSIPYTYKKVDTKNKGDDDKFAQAISKMLEEDKTLRFVQDKENHQSLLYGIGDQQLDVVVSRLLTRYKVEVELSKPRVPYRETIRKMVEKQGKHKKQSGGAGQYGDVTIKFEPSEEEFEFVDATVGGCVPKQFIPAVEKGLRDCMEKGPLAGCKCQNIKATLHFGSYHAVDSDEMSFKIAASLAFKKGIVEAKPCLLEPIMKLEILVPGDFVGAIMGDLPNRRGVVMGMDPAPGGAQILHAEVPQAELLDYATALRSMTQAKGSFTMEFSKYQQVPQMNAQKIIAAHKAEEEEAGK